MEAEVIKVYRKNNKIIGYKIQDDLGNNRNIEANALKKAIKEEKINLTNYKLTSSNRLIKRRVPTNSNGLCDYILMNKDIKVNIPMQTSTLFGNSEHPFPEKQCISFRK